MHTICFMQLSILEIEFSYLRSYTLQHKLQSELDDQEQRWADKLVQARKRVHELENALRDTDRRTDQTVNEATAQMERYGVQGWCRDDAVWCTMRAWRVPPLCGD
jgi:predicted  nucleic acid-binding Zn-ribbon protein